MTLAHNIQSATEHAFEYLRDLDERIEPLGTCAMQHLAVHNGNLLVGSG